MLSNSVILITPDELTAIVEAAVNKAIAGRILEGPEQPPEDVLIDRSELVRRLGCSEQTVIKLERKGKIPCYRVGDAARYSWKSVQAALTYKVRK